MEFAEDFPMAESPRNGRCVSKCPRCGIWIDALTFGLLQSAIDAHIAQRHLVYLDEDCDVVVGHS